MKILRKTLCLAILSSIPLGATAAAPEPGMMVGAPPPPDRQVTLGNWLVAPTNVWAFQHMDAIMPSTTVDRGIGPVSPLDVKLADLSAFEFTDSTGKRRTLAQFVDDLHADSLVLWSR